VALGGYISFGSPIYEVTHRAVRIPYDSIRDICSDNCLRDKRMLEVFNYCENER
jgi:hypothetical protein